MRAKWALIILEARLPRAVSGWQRLSRLAAVAAQWADERGRERPDCPAFCGEGQRFRSIAVKRSQLSLDSCEPPHLPPPPRYPGAVGLYGSGSVERARPSRAGRSALFGLGSADEVAVGLITPHYYATLLYRVMAALFPLLRRVKVAKISPATSERAH